MPLKNNTILYADDDLDDAFVFKQSFERHDHLTIVHLANGFETLKYLNHAVLSDSLPCLIVLDLNMPGKDGRQTLIEIKESPSLKNIAVILFTTSNSRVDKEFALKWDADFVTKPLLYEDHLKLADQLSAFCESVSR